MTPKNKKPKFITPPNHLKMKVGNGGIAEEKLQKAQELMENFQVNFKPDAQKLSSELGRQTKTITELIKKDKSFEKDKMVMPIMQLKANGGMFQYQLLTDVADICLQFMETVDEFNPEAMDIIKAHENAIQLIIKNELKGNGGAEGYALVQELHKACKRYFKRFEV